MKSDTGIVKPGAVVCVDVVFCGGGGGGVVDDEFCGVGGGAGVDGFEGLYR
ncbi:hypothetical protein GCM10007112_22840 [Vulcanisaeta souniana JCM 11219]|uniref:Uncharacterized protein n=1 Tax=Vulcanisaeta souniana JCM 11219 TaxID=1293586 RepID=A0A830ECA3_9CREN|nr:hypothetical protein GCM10007112_22840 [Vulcanisaeta souniana JCM 11219]